MRWLHLSDLHYSPAGQNYDTRTMLEKLRECIVNEGITVEEVFLQAIFALPKNRAASPPNRLRWNCAKSQGWLAVATRRRYI
jgi:hypothetical protein